MEIFIQFDQEGLYQNHPWDLPIPYNKGEILAVNPLSAIVLIERNEAHLYLKDQGLRISTDS